MRALACAVGVALVMGVGAERARAQEVDPPSPIPWVVAGTGVVALGLGGVFAAVSGGARSEAETSPIGEDAAAAADRSQTFATLSNVMLLASFVLITTGVAWGAVELTRPRRRGVGVEAHLQLLPGGLSLGGRF